MDLEQVYIIYFYKITCCEPLSWKSSNMLMTNEDVQIDSQLDDFLLLF